MEELLTPTEVAKRLKVEKRTVVEWLRSRQLRGIKLGRLWRIRIRELEDFIQRHEDGDGRR